MKRLWIIIVLLVVLLSLGVFFLFNKPAENDIETVEEPREVIEVIEPKPELYIKSLSSNQTLELSEEEVTYIEEDKLILLSYLDDVNRLIYDYDEDNNKFVLVYEDQIIRVDFNADTMTINDGQAEANTFIIKKLDGLYISIEELVKQFQVEYFIMKDPLYQLTLDFNSDGSKTYLIKEIIDEKRNALPEKITMTWEAVYSRKTDVSSLYSMQGLDVISPVWYEVTDETASLSSKKQDDYIEWARSENLELWPAVTNSFDPDMTSIIVNDSVLRKTLIDKLLNLYVDNGFEGINIDFENIYKADKDKLSQFIAELTAAFHQKGILVSMDVTFPGGSDNWSKCYDHYELGQWLDYMVVMSYDEHWGSSPVSGSVASLNWLDKNFATLTQMVDSDKLIMGIPFYMRVWFERPHPDQVNRMKVTSDAITMHKMESILSSGDYNILWDENAAQNYISFIDPKDNAVKKIWIEDAESLQYKVEMVHKYGLKGIAAWRRGYELESIWQVLENSLEKSE
ncbi:glycosyl hydrolase family 18 protein [Acidaminobacter sp. JC074]|uniref:glycosyl hydrolase family 18 protein n=1 Tax=Acidaminobacter sp. JC074 TaxID=2530199 RepID=UPI001F0EA292|nr:glycosyl hydrolase family 18 protein [Acidaminobacter sp. JC074]